MNASYKIVLLGAFVLFAAVVGYYIFSGDDTADENPLGDDYAVNDPAPEPDDSTPTPAAEPAPRPVLEQDPPSPAPEPEEETIGETTDDLPEAPVFETVPGDEALADADPTGDPVRPAPEPTDEPATEDLADPTEETTEPGEDFRPGPAPEPTDPVEETTEPDPRTEPEAEPSPRPVPPDPETIPRTYTVKEGDLLSTIALEFYGDEAKWFQIAQANPTIDPKRLQIGQVIVLPNSDAAVREREEVRPPAPGQDANYTVRPGDNLSKIAKKFYGDAEKWDLIYARNRKLIGPRPDALKVGMDLVIPQAYEGAE